jgi:hypothetical protein
MASLAEIRAKLVAQQNKADNKGQNFGGDRAMFPFWNAQDGQTSTIRFLPDADPNNVYFWVERLVIKMPFQGIKDEHDKEVLVQVPCMEMYGETCPVLAETRAWWKDESLVNLARTYWKKKSYIFNGFVVNSAVEEQELPENPIRRFAINSSIFDIIKSSLMNPEMEDLPTDYTSGRDFALKKTKKGEYANYSTSNWSFKTRALSEAEKEAINTHGLFNLKDFLPKKPTAEEVEIIKQMFQASVNDEAYDSARWSNFFKPQGSYSPTPAVQASSSYTAQTVPTFVAKPVVNAQPIDEDEDSSETNVAVSSSASAALARLQARNNTNNASVAESSGNTTKKDPRDILKRLNERNRA